MKIKLFIFLMFIVVALGFSISIDEFDEFFDFSLTLGDLHNLTADNDLDSLDNEKFILISGSVAARNVIQSDETTFLGELILVDGDWIGVENVVKYECIIQLSGLEYASMIPSRRSRTVNPEEITLNSKIFIIGKVTGTRVLSGDLIVPVVSGFRIRKIQ